MTTVEIAQQFEDKLVELYAEYASLHEQFDLYRGVQVNDENMEIINNLLHDIQIKYAEMYPMLNYIAYRYQSSFNTLNEYKQFMEALERTGAVEQQGKIVHH